MVDSLVADVQTVSHTAQPVHKPLALTNILGSGPQLVDSALRIFNHLGEGVLGRKVQSPGTLDVSDCSHVAGFGVLHSLVSKFKNCGSLPCSRRRVHTPSSCL